MSDEDDLYEVTPPPIPDELAERLLSGIGSDAEVASTAGLETVFSALRAPADPTELAGMDAVVATFQGAVVTQIAGLSTARTRPMLKKILTGKAIATVGAITLISAGAAAAATGTVPSPFSSDKAKEVTVEHVPAIARDNVAKHSDQPDDDVTEATEPTEATDEATDPTDNATDSTDDANDSGAEAVGPDATGPARYGLCTAFAAHDEHHDGEAGDEVQTVSTDLPVPFQNLTDAAAAAGQTVEEFCADATPGKSDSAPGHDDDSPSATAPGHTDNPSVTAPGRSDDSPSATAPGHTDDNPSVTAPGHAGDNPSVTAPGSSDGHGSGHSSNP